MYWQDFNRRRRVRKLSDMEEYRQDRSDAPAAVLAAPVAIPEPDAPAPWDDPAYDVDDDPADEEERAVVLALAAAAETPGAEWLEDGAEESEVAPR